MDEKKKKSLPSVYSFPAIVIDSGNMGEFNRSEGQDTKWYTDCFVVEVPCKGWLCQRLHGYLPPGGRVFAKSPGVMHLFFKPGKTKTEEGYSEWLKS